MNRRLLIAPLLATAVFAVACDKDQPKADTTPSATASAAPASTPSATTASNASAAPTASGAVAPAASSAAAAPKASGATAAGTGAPAAPAAVGDVTFTPFKQKSHGYTVDVPSIFTAKSDPKNIDGQDWTMADKAEMKSVGLTTLGETIDDLFGDDSKKPGVTEKTKKDNWYVIKGKAPSGARPNFFQKTFVTSSSRYDLEFRYDDSVKAQLDPVIQHVADSFKPGK